MVRDAGAGRWLLREPLPDADARLFCFPYAGAGASSLRHWPKRIGGLDVCAVQPPGRENRIREEPYHSFEDFADDAAEGLAPYLDRPYALFGHCMGALLAYATLVRLEQRGRPLPARLYVSSSLVPSRGFFGLFTPDMTDERLADELRAVVRSIGEPEPLPELLPMAIRVLRNDVDMCYSYRPPGPVALPCPITAVGWRDDPYVPPAEMREWDDYGTTHHEVLPGGPFTFLSAPPELIALIDDDFTTTAGPSAGTTAAAGTRGGTA